MAAQAAPRSPSSRRSSARCKDIRTAAGPAASRSWTILDKLKAGRNGPVKHAGRARHHDPASGSGSGSWRRRAGPAITFEGTAATIDDVSGFMAALKTSRYFSKVELKKTAASGASKGGLRLVDFDDHRLRDLRRAGGAGGAGGRRTPAGPRRARQGVAPWTSSSTGSSRLPSGPEGRHRRRR
ncbi:MAG: PilN domain-containing protein [Ignavibacteriales bacterium]|nr:PilN domain-containing protein [Ignavibacteriales bacterium]